MKQRVLIVLGRFGDIYMALKEMKDPCTLLCYPDFALIANELFPQHTVTTVSRNYSRAAAIDFAKYTFPDADIICAQQDGAQLEEYVEFRNYQNFQVYHAQQLQEGYHIS